MIEFYKYIYGLSVPIMNDVFTKSIKPKKHGTDMVAYKAAQFWNTPPMKYEFIQVQKEKTGIVVTPLQDLLNFCYGVGFTN